MQSPRIPMTVEEYEKMPWRFGWKHEYWEGCAHLTPRETHVCVSRPVVMQPMPDVPAHVQVHVATPDAAERLIECFVATFEDGVEFCNWQQRDFLKHARRNIADFFAARRGAPLPVSRFVTLRNSISTNVDEIIAAALFTEKQPRAATLDLLMVRPSFHRQHLANTLVTLAMNDLYARDYHTLRSAYVAANIESTAWHTAFGFQEEPDLFLANLRRSFYLHEASRFEDATEPEACQQHARLQAAYEFWRRRAIELEAIRERDGYEAVAPIMRDEW